MVVAVGMLSLNVNLSVDVNERLKLILIVLLDSVRAKCKKKIF